MKQYLDKSLSYLKSAFSEANGTGSSKRFYGLLFCLSINGVLWYVTIVKRMEPYFTATFTAVCGLFTAVVIGSVVKDSNTKGSTAQSVPGSPSDTKQ